MTKQYLSENTELMKEWDWKANADLAPSSLTLGSHKKAWWKCPKCKGKWQAYISDRTGKDSRHHTKCPYCSGRKVLSGFNDLATINPRLASEWHPTKNGNLKPVDVTIGSGKKVWWKCSKCGHEWQAIIESRVLYHRGCPACSNKVCVPGKNDLATTQVKVNTPAE